MDAVLIPKGAGGKRGSQGHVDMWGMFSRTKHKDEAWLLHQWFANKETVAGAASWRSACPARASDGWNDPTVVGKPMFRVFKDFVEKEGVGLIALPWNLRMLEFSNTVIPKAFEPMWTGAVSVDQAIAAARDRCSSCSTSRARRPPGRRCPLQRAAQCPAAPIES